MYDLQTKLKIKSPENRPVKVPFPGLLFTSLYQSLFFAHIVIVVFVFFVIVFVIFLFPAFE